MSSAANLTTVTGTAKLCDNDNYVALMFRCTGPHCSYLQNNFTCSQPDAPHWVCNNNITCTGSSHFVSNFTFNQPNVTITATQHVAINGTGFILTQDENGNVTTSNATASSSQTPSPSGSLARRQNLSWPLLVLITMLALMFTQVNAAKIPCISQIVNFLNLVESKAEGNLEQFQQQLCENFGGSTLNAAVGPATEIAIFGLCLRFAFVLEAEFNLVAVGASVLSGSFEVVVPGLALAETIAATAACIAIADCEWDMFLDHAAKLLCETSSLPPSISSSTLSPPTHSPTPSPTPSATPGPAPGLNIPSVAGDKCASCQLSLYAIGIMGLAQQCHVPVPMGTAYDVSVLLCDSSYNGKYADFCKTLCANQCATYNINDWIKSAGSTYMSNANLGGCSSYCPGFKGDGRCQLSDPCPCAVGAETCRAC